MGTGEGSGEGAEPLKSQPPSLVCSLIHIFSLSLFIVVCYDSVLATWRTSSTFGCARYIAVIDTVFTVRAHDTYSNGYG